MLKWIEDFKNANTKTKNFILITVIFSAVLILSSVYCYMRLESVKSFVKNQGQQG